MAVDTKAKRASATTLLVPCYAKGVVPGTNGIDANERLDAGWVYRGILPFASAIGALTIAAVTASGSGTVTYTGSGTPSIAAVTASGSGTSAGSSSTTTNQAAITANRSIGQEDYNYPGKTGFEAAFAKITLPDLTGYTLTAATFKARLFSGSGPGTDTNCTIYAKVASNAWDESSGVSTLNTLESEFNLVSDLLDTVAVSETGGTEFEFDVLGDATHGLLGAYTANSNPGAITIMLRIPVIGSITSDFAQTSFLVGDEKFTDPYRVFYSRSDATYYPRITLEYTATGANEGTGALTVGEATASGSGVVTYTATGALTTPVTTAQGNDANVGSGTPTTPQAIVTGVGAVIYTASGTPAVASITASGLAATTYTGTGALVTPKPTIFGIYDKSDLVIPLPTVSGSGAVTNQNIGSLSIPVTTVSGTGSHSLVTTDPDTGALTGLNRNIASYSWKSINAKGDVETRRAFQRLDMAMQEIVTNVNNDLTNIVNGTTPVGVDLSELEAAIDALEASVSALQTTSTDHETRIEALEGDAGEVIAGVSGTTRGVFVAHNGAGGNTPAVLKLESRNGTYWYVFVADDGTLRVHSSLPANNNDGTIVGLQN